MTDNSSIREKKGSDYEEQQYCDAMARRLVAERAAATASPVVPVATPTTAAFNDAAPKEPKTFWTRMVEKIVTPINDKLAKWGMD
jgi:hypothetical protein